MLWIFFPPEKSDGFGRVRTRDLGWQRPAPKPLERGFYRAVFTYGALQQG
jgi:hypothetical protein